MALQVVPTLSGDAVTTHAYSLIFPIENIDYSFSFKYNPRQDRWILDIIHPNGDPVVVGAVILYGVELFSYAVPSLRPRGSLQCIWKSLEDSASEPGEFDLGKTAFLFYFERPEDLTPSVPTDPPLA